LRQAQRLGEGQEFGIALGRRVTQAERAHMIRGSSDSEGTEGAEAAVVGTGHDHARRRPEHRPGERRDHHVGRQRLAVGIDRIGGR
jgi:hypothetical protein